MTTLEFITATEGYFARHGVDSPKFTAELMLAEALQKKRLQLYLEFDKEILPSVLDILRPLVKRRAQGEPLQYIQGFAEFAGARFTVTPDVLIPRPETELLLEALLPKIDPSGLGAPLADIGTGSGILAVTLARRFPQLQVHAVDASEAALAVAKRNSAELTNLTFHHGDLLAPLPDIPFQALVANLPYIPSADIGTLSREVQKEPHTALDGGPDGLDLIRRLLSQIAARPALSPKTIGLEIGDGQAITVEALLKETGFGTVETIKDLRGTVRILIGNA